MKKLTKEQSEFLIDKVDRIFLMENKEALFNDKIVKIINECTEKEFPVFRFEDECDCDSFVEVRLFCETDNLIGVELPQGYINLYPHEFKQFTEGCNKIVKWQEGQE